MAIAKIKKIELLGLNKDKERLLFSLQNLGRVELINIRQQDSRIGLQSVSYDINLAGLEEAITFLASFTKEKTGFLQGVANIKPVIYRQELKEVIGQFGWQAILKELSDLRNHLKDLTQHKEKLVQKRQLLFPWQNLTLPMEENFSTQHCGIFLGVLNAHDYSDCLKNAAEKNILFFSEIVSQDKTSIHLVITYLKEDFQPLEQLLKNFHFNFVTLGLHKGTVRDNLLEINREILVLDDQISEAKEGVAELSKEQFKLKIVYDYLANIKKINEAEGNLSQQQYTFALSAWARFKDIAPLEREIARNFKDVAIFVSEPKPEENIPVILDNKKFIQPFEFITQIYGMPKYNELDPTPFLAPFFFLYFGFCVSDVGYGIMLFLISWLALKKFKMGAQGKKFFKLFLFCGISTIIVGALTGSWFGNLFDLLAEGNKIFLPLKRFKDSLILLDPLKEPTKLLGIALMFGVIQVWFGNIVAAIGNIKNKRFLDILLDQVPMLAFLFGFTGLGLIFLKLLSDAQASLFKYCIIAGAIGLALTQGRAEKGIGSKLFYGIYNLYNAFSGYLSDILSYSRLWALGLVTGVMAATVNLLAVQFSQIVPTVLPFLNKVSFIKIIISALVLITIFVLGHIMSFLMNLLGAFVHPVRLQFVEFFSKFFKSGGSTLRPFKVETKYININ